MGYVGAGMWWEGQCSWGVASGSRDGFVFVRAVEKGRIGW